jgi:hypothetical protein
MIARKTYLGDGVYVEVNDEGIVLTTEDGVNVTNTVVLDYSVYTSLTNWVTNLIAKPEHQWEFYANGTFCKRCGAQIGSGVDCK